MGNIQRVLIVGAGRGGTALLELFLDDPQIEIVGIVDANPQAPALAIAAKHGIPNFTNLAEAAEASRPCLAFNLTGDDEVTAYIEERLGQGNVVGGFQAFFLWKVVTHLKQTNEALACSRSHLNAIFDSTADAIITTSENGVIETCNPAVSHVFGYTPEELMGQNIGMLMSAENRKSPDHHLFHPDDLPNGLAREIYATHKDGNCFPLQATISAMRVAEQRHFVGIFRDISDQKKQEEQILHLAHHDTLTGLPNRTLFYDRLNHALAHARRNEGSFAVLFIDLDGFKFVNDNFGHSTGDMLLREVANRLTACVREADTVARMGGDEFTMILDNVDNVYEPTNAERVASEIITALARPFDLGENLCTVTASIGITIYPHNGKLADMLIKLADAAMYAAKQGGKNCYRFSSQTTDCANMPEGEVKQAPANTMPAG